MKKKILAVLMLSVTFVPSVFASRQDGNGEPQVGEHNRPSEFQQGSVTCRFQRHSAAPEKSDSNSGDSKSGSALEK